MTTTNVTADMETTKKPPGLLQEKFVFKKLPNGNLDKTKVVCTLCNAELVYCRGSSSLKYHLNAKHPLADAEDAGPSTDVAQGFIKLLCLSATEASPSAQLNQPG